MTHTTLVVVTSLVLFVVTTAVSLVVSIITGRYLYSRRTEIERANTYIQKRELEYAKK